MKLTDLAGMDQPQERKRIAAALRSLRRQPRTLTPEAAARMIDEQRAVQSQLARVPGGSGYIIGRERT